MLPITIYFITKQWKSNPINKVALYFINYIVSIFPFFARRHLSRSSYFYGVFYCLVPGKPQLQLDILYTADCLSLKLSVFIINQLKTSPIGRHLSQLHWRALDRVFSFFRSLKVPTSLYILIIGRSPACCLIYFYFLF